MKVAIYARVNTDKQEKENQLVQLREFATKHGWTTNAEFVDYESGSKADRTEFQRMFKDAASTSSMFFFSGPSTDSRAKACLRRCST
jgi:DNA invertase Pin-like site-specific DNA recombinase